MVIGLIGADLNSSNKGCEALAYSFLEILNSLAEKNRCEIDVILVKNLPTKEWIKSGLSFEKISKLYVSKKEYSNLRFQVAFCYHTKNKVFFPHQLKNTAYVIDFTGGDSFSDIYGKERFYSRTYLKSAIIKKNIPLILGNQTIGPFKDKNVEATATKVILDCKEVFARDEMSYEYTYRISGRYPILTTDIAFALPFERKQKSGNLIRVGLNISGLLWDGGYTKNNQFGLKCNYQEYCRRVIVSLLNCGTYEVHLIPHAFKENVMQDVDNDLVPINILHKEYPETIVSPYFDFCIDAKSYIASMDVFTGARMHSTIGSFSSGVPVIPFSYSRKFEGLFDALKYPYVVEATKWDTDTCVEKTLSWVRDYELLKENMYTGQAIIKDRLNNCITRLEEILF